MNNEHADHVVLINDEEQYSLWPVHRPVPHGWRIDGNAGSREECLARIAEVWTDMRPRSLREALARSEQAVRNR
jgi:MbtH protein